MPPEKRFNDKDAQTKVNGQLSCKSLIVGWQNPINSILTEKVIPPGNPSRARALASYVRLRGKFSSTPISLLPELIQSAKRPNFVPPVVAGRRMNCKIKRCVSAQRSAHGLQVSAIEYIAAQKRRLQLTQKANATFNELDCWLSPTVPFEPIAVADIESGELHERALLASRNTQPGNLFGFCAMSLPMQKEGLPTGLQIMMPGNADKELLETSMAIETVIGQ